jgi:UDP-glucose-4-epimerase GalE
VTGGAGYIGSHAAKALHRAGYEVVVFDSLAAGHREAVQWGPLVEGDAADVDAVRAALRRYPVCGVLHFAALLDVGESVREPLRYYRQNVGGALGVLEAMAAEGVRRFILSSTCAVYGEPREVPMRESHPREPINSYGETKLAIERALGHIGRATGIRSISLRYFNAAGADPDGDLGEDHRPEIHLIPRALEAASGGPHLAIFGDDYPTPDGTCQRDYVHVTDLADAHVRALEALEALDGDAASPARAYNLGTGRPYSVHEVIAAVERATGRSVPRQVAPRRPGDPAVLCAAPEKARAELGWTPARSDLDTIVGTAWRWRQAHPHGYGGAAVTRRA